MITDPYKKSILTQRKAREKRLLSNPRNWFSLIGLFLLAGGENIIGGTQGNAINIPGLPLGIIAVLKLQDAKVTLMECTPDLQVNGKPAELRTLATDHDEVTDVLSVDGIHFIIIQRGECFFLRAWDVNARAARNFAGLNYFPVAPAWRITAKFNSFPQPQILPVEDVIGTKYESKFIGRAVFTINGETCSLIAEEDDEELLFSFTDLTKSDSTYPGGRFFTTALPENNEVVIDFNLAKNWPCAYTPHATCPLPPFENHLKVRIEAGEKRYSSPV